MESWEDLRVFLALVRHRRHASAARALAVDPTTVGRRVAALQERLGVRLFARTPSGFAVTEAGATLAAHVEMVEAQVATAERSLGGSDARVEGLVRVTAPDGISSGLLAPALAAFRRAHPGIRLELQADNRSLDLARREADLAVRLSRPSARSLIARRLGRLSFALYASNDYLARAGRPRTVRELADHDWVGFLSALDDSLPARWMRRHLGPVRWALRSNSTPVLAAACAAGAGLALLPRSFARAWPGLVEALPRAPVPTAEVWAVTHPDLHPSARIKALLAWLTDAFARAADGWSH